MKLVIYRRPQPPVDQSWNFDDDFIINNWINWYNIYWSVILKFDPFAVSRRLKLLKNHFWGLLNVTYKFDEDWMIRTIYLRCLIFRGFGVWMVTVEVTFFFYFPGRMLAEGSVPVKLRYIFWNSLLNFILIRNFNAYWYQ